MPESIDAMRGRGIRGYPVGDVRAARNTSVRLIHAMALESIRQQVRLRRCQNAGATASAAEDLRPSRGSPRLRRDIQAAIRLRTGRRGRIRTQPEGGTLSRRGISEPRTGLGAAHRISNRACSLPRLTAELAAEQGVSNNKGQCSGMILCCLQLQGRQRPLRRRAGMRAAQKKEAQRREISRRFHAPRTKRYLRRLVSLFCRDRPWPARVQGAARERRPGEATGAPPTCAFAARRIASARPAARLPKTARNPARTAPFDGYETPKAAGGEQ